MVPFDPYFAMTRHDLRGRFATMLEAPAVAVQTVNDRWVESTPSSVAPAWYRELANFGEMEENWDGYGSPRISVDVLKTACQIVIESQCLNLPTPHISPTTGGGVNIEWAIADRELEVEVMPNGEVEYLRSEGEEMHDGSLNLEGDGFQGLAGWLKSGSEQAAAA